MRTVTAGPRLVNGDILGTYAVQDMRISKPLLLAAPLSPSAGWAREATGTIVGTVMDASVSAISGARVTVTDMDKNLAERTVKSGNAGVYVAALLPVGQYRLAACAPGFKKLASDGLESHVAGKLTIPFTLEMGAVTEEVTWGGPGILSGVSQATVRPDAVVDPNQNAPHTVAQWFNSASYGPVPTGVVRPGKAPASAMVGPDSGQWDISLIRNIRIRERGRLQIRGETFNFLKHANYFGPGTVLGASNYGQVTSTREPRRIHSALKLGFWGASWE